MRELTQTVTGATGNCWQTSVACILDLDPETMPAQAEYDWKKKDEKGETVYGPMYHNALQGYLRKHHGLAYVELHQPDSIQSVVQIKPGTLHMLTGRTVRSDALGGARHVVVARDGEMIWDPHPSRAGLLDEFRWAFLVPWPKQWDKSETKCECPVCKAEVVSA